jgi:large repetitive protein
MLTIYIFRLFFFIHIAITSTFLNPFLGSVSTSYTLIVPEAFVPDGSDPDDREFKVYAKGLKNIELYVFNTWGELIFSSDDVDKGWSGYHRNYPAPNGSYVYKVTAIVESTSEKIEKSGVFLLIR